MTEAEQILESARTVLVVDWPSRDVPDTLAEAGYTVVVKGGPEPDNYLVRELQDGEIVVRDIHRRPEQANLVYSHRPLDELPGIVTMAKEIGARAVWCQSGLASDETKDPAGCWVPDDASRKARRLVESAGLLYIQDPYIADTVRRLKLDNERRM
jgi:predicted CoA-binding protein